MPRRTDIEDERSSPSSHPAPDGALSLSVVIPALNEAANLAKTLYGVRAALGPTETIVVDGGSRDDTVAIAQCAGATVIETASGRGHQLAAGARAATGDVLWFLHADTVPSQACGESIRRAMRRPGVVGGNCSLRFDGDRRCARFLTWLYPRLRTLGLMYGDSGIFAERETYQRIGGFKPIPLFEDLDLVRRLRAQGKLVHLSASVTTSSRRFENGSFTLTFAFWCWLQILYWSGVDAHRLGRLYYGMKQSLEPAKRPTEITP